MTDKNIDSVGAKYWCMFADGSFKKLIDGLNDPKKAQNALNKDIKDAGIEKALNEAGPESEGRGLQKKIDKMTGGPVPPAEQARLRKLYKTDRAAFLSDPYVTKRRDAYMKIADKNNDTKGIIMDMDDNGNPVPKTMADAERDTTIGGFLSNVGKGFMGNMGSILTSVATGAAIAGLSYLLFKSAPYLLSKCKYMVKKLTSGNALAECRFETSDGTEYRFWYDMKVNKWILGYTSMKIMGKDSFPPRDEVDSFLETDFCKKFVERCKAILTPVFECKDLPNIIEKTKLVGSGRERKTILDILGKKDIIVGNMFAYKIRYQD